MKLWCRYLFFRLTSTFAFMLLCIFAMYVVIDLSIHGAQFTNAASLSSTTLYYLRNFAVHLDLFFPLTFLLSTMRTLFDLSAHRELIALQMAGISSKKLLAPFFLFATLLSALCYCNSEWIMPDAQDEAIAFQSACLQKGKKDLPRLFTITLKDDSELICQRFDSQAQALFDVFWVKSAQDIWHIKYLKVDGPCPRALFADHFTRSPSRLLEKTESFDALDLPQMPFDPLDAVHRFVPFESRSLSTLFRQSHIESSQKISVLSHLHYKLALPLIPFLMLLAIAPFSLRFSRNAPTLAIAACAILAFVFLKTLLDSLLILSENNVLPPPLAIWTPIVLLFASTLHLNLSE